MCKHDCGEEWRDLADAWQAVSSGRYLGAVFAATVCHRLHFVVNTGLDELTILLFLRCYGRFLAVYNITVHVYYQRKSQFGLAVRD